MVGTVVVTSQSSQDSVVVLTLTIEQNASNGETSLLVVKCILLMRKTKFPKQGNIAASIGKKTIIFMEKKMLDKAYSMLMIVLLYG